MASNTIDVRASHGGRTDENESNPQSAIKFNNIYFSSWTAARDKLTVLTSKARAGSVWTRLDVVDDASVHVDAFKLVCKSCGQGCQLGNPSKWHTKDHTADTCRAAQVKRAATISSEPSSIRA